MVEKGIDSLSSAGVPVKLSMRSNIDIYIFIVASIFGIWLLLVMISPYLVLSGQLTDLSGAVFTIENTQKIEGINPIAWLIYSAGDANCHQLQERSLFLNDNQMPFCARDVGGFIGAFFGSFAALVFVLRMKWQLLLIALLPLAIDALTQELTAYESTNEIRLITGFLAGAAGTIFICQYVAMPTNEAKDETPEIMDSK